MEEEQVAATADGTPKKKRTRRGTRGGRGRKKPTAARRPTAPTGHRMIPATVVLHSPESTCRLPISKSPRWPLKRLPSRSRPTGLKPRRPLSRSLSDPTVNRSESARVAGRVAARSGGSRRPPTAMPKPPPRTRQLRTSRLRNRSWRRKSSATASFRVRSDVRVDRRLRSALTRLAAIMLRLCGPTARFDLPRKP